jgi:heme O synthase-like polyprenyltransferase
MNKTFRNYLLSIVVIIPIAFVVGLTTKPAYAALVGVMGTFFVMMGWLFYAAIVDSRKRWPGTTWVDRLSRIVTFQR